MQVDPNNKKEVLGQRNILALFTSSQKHTIINEISEIINNKRQRTRSMYMMHIAVVTWHLWEQVIRNIHLVCENQTQ
jgi:hypothetical protein